MKNRKMNNSSKAFSIISITIILAIITIVYRRDQTETFQARYQLLDQWQSSKKPDQHLDRDQLKQIVTNQTAQTAKTEVRKVILSIDKGGPWVLSKIHFNGCEYSNCDLIYSPDNISYALQADSLIFVPNTTQSLLQFPRDIRQRQLWFVTSMEPPAYPWHRFNKIVNNFNGSMTYLRNSTPVQFFLRAHRERA